MCVRLYDGRVSEHGENIRHIRVQVLCALGNRISPRRVYYLGQLQAAGTSTSHSKLRGPVQLGSVAADMSDIHRLSLYHALIHDPSCPHTCDGLLHQ